MTNFTDLRNSYFAARDAHDAAQKAEIETRRAEHDASVLLAKALYSHVSDLYTKDEVKMTKALGEIQIVAIRCDSWDPAKVYAVFTSRIKSGAFGKTRTTSGGLTWDFDRDTWTEC